MGYHVKTMQSHVISMLALGVYRSNLFSGAAQNQGGQSKQHSLARDGTYRKKLPLTRDSTVCKTRSPLTGSTSVRSYYLTVRSVNTSRFYYILAAKSASASNRPEERAEAGLRQGSLFQCGRGEVIRGSFGREGAEDVAGLGVGLPPSFPSGILVSAGSVRLESSLPIIRRIRRYRYMLE